MPYHGGPERTNVIGEYGKGRETRSRVDESNFPNTVTYWERIWNTLDKDFTRLCCLSVVMTLVQQELAYKVAMARSLRAAWQRTTLAGHSAPPMVVVRIYADASSVSTKTKDKINA